jgi:hypothetical protein
VDFGALLEPNFSPFFGPFRVPNFPVLLGLCAPEMILGPLLSWFSVVHLGSVLVDLGPVRTDFSSGQISGTFLATWCPDAICVKRSAGLAKTVFGPV